MNVSIEFGGNNLNDIFLQQDDEDDSDDDDLSDFDIDETTLETYLTPIDDEDCDNPIDEYIAFQQVHTRNINTQQYYLVLDTFCP